MGRDMGWVLAKLQRALYDDQGSFLSRGKPKSSQKGLLGTPLGGSTELAAQVLPVLPMDH